MGSPVRLDHGEPDSLIQGWVCNYAIATPGVKSATNSTVRLGRDDVPQPDALLRIVPECGGQARVNAKGYLEGAPELIVEVAASSTSLDTREKLLAYRRAGVREYLIWRTAEEAFDWWVLEEDEYRALPASSQGVITSQVFAGLWLDVTALLAGDGSKLMAKLQEGIATPAHAGFVTALQARAKEGRS